jgi:hypothetical protein
MSMKRVSGIVGSVVLVAFVALAGYWFLQRTQPENCRICQRPIHAQARAVVEENGKREAVCCVRCAFRQHEQRHVAIRLLEVTDYVSGRPLAPEEAFYVEGSRIVLCARHEPMLDETKHPHETVLTAALPVSMPSRKRAKRAPSPPRTAAWCDASPTMKEIEPTAINRIIRFSATTAS